METAFDKQLKYLLIVLLCLPLFITLKVYGQDTSSRLDYIAVNNEVKEEENGTLTIYRQDTIKVAGIATPDDIVKVSLDNKDYLTTADQYGNWFVLFSVQNLEKGDYPVQLQVNNSTNIETLTTLTIQEEAANVKGSTSKPLAVENFNIYILVAVLLLIPSMLFLRSRYTKKQK